MSKNMFVFGKSGFDNFQVEEEMSDENSTELNDNDVMKRFNQELESVSPA